MRICITGDTHHNYDIGKILNLTENMERLNAEPLDADDYLIIAGDFGIPTFGRTLDSEDKYLDFYINQPYTTLFIDGNHENFDELNSLPVEEWCGGKVHKLADNVIHLIRGQVFDIDGQKIFTLGGAYSPDKEYRIPGFTWFEEEELSLDDMDEALNNLGKHNYKVDYVITHTCGAEFLKKNAYRFEFVFNPEYCKKTENFLDYLHDGIDCKKWIFGHFHKDLMIDTKYISSYNKVYEVKDGDVIGVY